MEPAPETAGSQPSAPPPATSTALVRRSPFDQIHELRQHLEDLEQIAQALCKATILPKEMQAPANLKLVLLQGMSMGFDIVQSIRASFVMPGGKDGGPPKVGYYVAGLIALIRSSPKCRFFRVEETTLAKCRVTCARTDEAESVIHTFALTIEEARAANMDKKWERGDNGKWEPKVKHPWMTAPADMLLWRVCGRAGKATFQDVVFGMATPDELDDLAAADAMDAAGDFAPIPVPAPVTAPTPRPSSPPAAAAEPVDAELVDEPPPATQAESVPESSGDPAWDALCGDLAQLASDESLRSALPPEVKAAWDQQLAKAKTKRDLNTLAPWIGHANRRAAASKACAEVAAHFTTSFNARNTKLREEEAAAKAAKGGAK